MDIVNLSQPTNWTDRSMIAYSKQDVPTSGVAPNIVVTKEDFVNISGSTDEERLKTFSAKQVSDMKAQLADPIIHLQQLTKILSKPATEVQLSWQSGHIRLTQLVFFIVYSSEQIVIFTATAAASEFAEFRDEFLQLAHRLEFS